MSSILIQYLFSCSCIEEVFVIFMFKFRPPTSTIFFYKLGVLCIKYDMSFNLNELQLKYLFRLRDQFSTNTCQYINTWSQTLVKKIILILIYYNYTFIHIHLFYLPIMNIINDTLIKYLKNFEDKCNSYYDTFVLNFYLVVWEDWSLY